MTRALLSVLIFFLSCLPVLATVELDADSNGAIDADKGGTNISVWETHFVDGSESDQGAIASGSGETIYDVAQAVGTTKSATITFRHTGVGSTTAYTLDTSFDASSYENLYFKFEPGAILAQNTGDEILTVYSPSNIIATNRQEITSDNMLAFSAGGTVYPGWWGAVGDRTADDTNAVQWAIDAAENMNGVVMLQDQYNVSSALTITDPMTLRGDGRGDWSTTAYNSEIYMSGTSPTAVIVVTGNSVKILDINIYGNDSVGGATAGHGIQFDGSGSAISAFELRSVRIVDCEESGIHTKGTVYALHATDCYIAFNSGKGIYIDSAGGGAVPTQLAFFGCRISNNASDNVYSDEDSADLRFIACTFADPTGVTQTGIHIDNGTSLTVIASHFENGDYGIQYEGTRGFYYDGNLASGQDISIINFTGVTTPAYIGSGNLWGSGTKSQGDVEGTGSVGGPAIIADKSIDTSNLTGFVFLQDTYSSNTANRPASPKTGQMYFNTERGYPEWYNGSDWTDGAIYTGGSETISSGEITATLKRHTVDTEAAAASDDLDTINGGIVGQILILMAADSTHTVVVKDGTGNLQLNGDFSMDHAHDTITLYRLDSGYWYELSRSDNNT